MARPRRAPLALLSLLCVSCGAQEGSMEGRPAPMPRMSSTLAPISWDTLPMRHGLLRRQPAGPNLMVNGPGHAPARNEPAIAWLPLRAGRLVVSANDYRSPGPLRSAAGHYASLDGGRSFTVDGLLPGVTRSSGGSYEGAGNTSVDCLLTEERQALCYVVSLVYDRTTPRSGIAVSRSLDGGRTWQEPILLVADNTTRVLHDKPWIAVDRSSGPRRGAVYVTWTRFEFAESGAYLASPIYLASSMDQGASFSAPRRLTAAPFETSQGSRPLVDREGRLHVVYQHYPDGEGRPSQHLLQSSADGGQRFSAPVRAGTVHELPMPIPPARYRTNSFPSAAADPVSGALHVAWADYQAGQADVLLATSLDGGASFGEPLRVNDTSVDARVHNLLPAAACGPLGRCGVAFYSTRNDPQDALLLDVYYAPIELRAPAGGGRAEVVTGRNIRVSDRSTDPGVGFGGQYLGDYIGLAISHMSAHPVWTDSRVESVDEMGRVVRVQSLFTHRVELAPDID